MFSASLLIAKAFLIDTKILRQKIEKTLKLAYFVKATNLLENLYRENNLFYIQASILVSLYVLQMAYIIKA